MRPQTKLKNSFVYAHLEADTGIPFYVGIGTTKTRPWDMSDRNESHKAVVAEHGIRVEIVIDDLTRDLAAWWEVRWIKALRKAGYNLVNRTTGGERGFIYNNESVERIRLANIGKKYSDEVNKKKGRKGPKLITEEGRATLKRAKSEKTKQLMREAALLVQPTLAQRQRNSEGCKRAWSKISREERQLRNKVNWHNSMTPEKIAARSEKAAETRRRNKLLKEGIA